MLLVAACSFAFVSCDKDDDEFDNDGQHTVTKDVKVTVSEDGTVSGGHTFAAIDNETFYIDCVKYSVVEGHLEVTGYDKTIFSGVANIVYSLNYKGNTCQVVKIAKGAFQECKKLTSVNMPSSLVEIGNWAFQDCSALTSISIPNSVTTIGPCAFDGCTSLTKATLPNSLKIIESSLFDDCSSLKSVNIPNSVEYIDEYAFARTALTEVTIPTSVKVLSQGAFYECESIRSVVIPNSVETIRDAVFAGCTSLKSVTLPNELTYIPGFMFSYCTSLSSIQIPKSVKHIGYDAFLHCTSLTAITLPNSVESIWGGAFTESGIKDVTMLSKNPPSCNNGVYGDCFDKGIAKLHVLPGCKNAYENYSITEYDYYAGEYTVHPYKEFFTDIIEDAKE